MTNGEESTAPPAAPGTVVGWPKNKLRVGSYEWPDKGQVETPDPGDVRPKVEPWLAALLQAEHVCLLVGNGLTTAVAAAAGVSAARMEGASWGSEYANAVHRVSKTTAAAAGRGDANIEDEVRAVRDLIGGLKVLAANEPGDDFTNKANTLLAAWTTDLKAQMKTLLESVLATEKGIRDSLVQSTDEAKAARRLLGSFLLTFASRTATRERLHIFTVNYDRLIEYGCDMLGLRVLDRFVGALEPMFRASRLGVDLHYNPPGIRGEPRYLEGVVRLTKLHGSIDWSQERDGMGVSRIVRSALPFGADGTHPGLPAEADELIIYPNPAKDLETLEYPYAELFRDFAAAACQPNAVLITYGYSFGDDHINRILRDMLTIPSTHLAILSWSDAGGRIPRFCEVVGRDEQITLLIGKHFGDLRTLVEHYLPKPAIDRTTWRMVELVNRRTPHVSPQRGAEAEGSVKHGAPSEGAE